LAKDFLSKIEEGVLTSEEGNVAANKVVTLVSSKISSNQKMSFLRIESSLFL